MTRSTGYQGEPACKAFGSAPAAFFQAGVASSPSKLTDTSSIRTNVRRLMLGSKGRVSPPKNPGRPGAPKRKNPSLPQVANSTENTSPRRSQVSAPNRAAMTALKIP